MTFINIIQEIHIELQENTHTKKIHIQNKKYNYKL